MIKLILLLLPFLCTFAKPVYTISLGEIPSMSESNIKGKLITLLKKIEKEANIKLDYNIYPFARSLQNSFNDDYDAHLPFIYLKNPKAKELRYSTTALFKVNFFLYTKKGNNVDINDLFGNKGIFLTDRAHVDYFDFPLKPVKSPDQGLRMVMSSRAKGFLYAELGTDPVIKANNYTGIEKLFFKEYEVKFIFNNKKNYKKLDGILTKAINALRSRNELDPIFMLRN